MDFKRTEEQELLLESLRELLERECPESYIKECDKKHAYPEKFINAIHSGGFSLLGVPEEYGGTPCDIVTLVMVCEEIAKLGMPAYHYANAYNVIDMASFGSKEQIKQTMDVALTGRKPFCLGITEPQAGSDDSSIATTATRKNGKVYINGHKTFISNADIVPYMLCVTRDFDNPDVHNAMSMWWVPMNVPGIKVERLYKIGWNMMSTNEVYLDNVELEEKDLVGVEGKGFQQLMANFEVERLINAAGAIGAAECAFGDALDYASQRVQFGKPIGNFQLTQEKLTYMAIKCENMRNMLYKIAWEIDNHIPVQISTALIKLYAAQAAGEVIDDALQILGGIGYTEDHRVSRLWRDIRVNRIAAGTDEIMIHIAGRGLIKQHLKRKKG